jgi:hypothetical protein
MSLCVLKEVLQYVCIVERGGRRGKKGDIQGVTLLSGVGKRKVTKVDPFFPISLSSFHFFLFPVDSTYIPAILVSSTLLFISSIDSLFTPLYLIHDEKDHCCRSRFS